ncbi:caspase domain-containing protein [Streptomyces sp. NPDC059835]|uniref:caspase family protein n=1 Tax=Streptomyces sp. NPDC059835 TaxID=3346967 RepID=UPI00364A4532
MTDRSAPSSRAVFFGVHEFQALPELEGVAKNIPALLDQLTDPELEALRREDCNHLSADSSRNQFLAAVHTAAKEASDLLLVYYAGHGQYSQNGQDLLLATKESSDGQDFFSVAYQDLKQQVEGSLARHKVVIIDCCHSGLAVRMGGGDPTEEDDAFTIEGACVLTSSAETEESLCLPTGSVFTLALVDVLKQGITGPLDGGGRRGEEQSHLQTGDVLRVLRGRLANRMEGGKKVPEPRIACRDDGFRIPLARNRAYTGEKPAAPVDAEGDHPPSPKFRPLTGAAITVCAAGNDPHAWRDYRPLTDLHRLVANGNHMPHHVYAGPRQVFPRLIPEGAQHQPLDVIFAFYHGYKNFHSDGRSLSVGPQRTQLRPDDLLPPFRKCVVLIDGVPTRVLDMVKQAGPRLDMESEEVGTPTLVILGRGRWPSVVDRLYGAITTPQDVDGMDGFEILAAAAHQLQSESDKFATLELVTRS